MRMLALMSAAAALTGCYSEIDKSDPRYAELEELNAWVQQLKADDPDTGSLLAQQCYEEGDGSPWSTEGVMTLSKCMRRKYDEGVRWVPDEEPESEV